MSLSLPAGTLRAYTKAEQDDIGVTVLLGDYIEKGFNHGRKFYQKSGKIPGHEDVDVLLYYWDTRDGADISGWWFGDRVGGSRVWARADTDDQTPPHEGWRVPWDGPPTPDVLLVECADDPFPRAGPVDNHSEESALVIVHRAEKLETEVSQALCAARELLDSEVASNVHEAESLLRQESAAVSRVQQDVAEARGKKVSLGTSKKLARFAPRLRAVLEKIDTEISRAKVVACDLQARAEKAAEEERAAEAQRRDSQAFQEALPRVMDVLAKAEDAVETCAIIAAPLDSPEDLGDMESTLTDLEDACASAQAALSEARRHIDREIQAAHQFADEVRVYAVTQFSELLQAATDAHKRLTPYKKMRHEFNARQAARKDIEEISERLSAAELDLTKASILTNEGQMSEKGVRDADMHLNTARELLDEAEELIDRKQRSSDDHFRNELEEIREFQAQIRMRLESGQESLDMQREGVAIRTVCLSAHEKVQRAEEAMIRINEAEVPFVNELVVQSEAIHQSEEAAILGELAVQEALVFLKEKMSDTEEFSEEGAQRVLNELSSLQKRTETAMRRMEQFVEETACRKTRLALKDVIAAVAKIEGQIPLLTEVASKLSLSDLSSVSAESLDSMCQAATKTENDVASLVADARKLLSDKHKEKKPALVTELIKVTARMKAVYNEYRKQKQIVLSGERLRQGKAMIEDATEKVKRAEDDVAKLVSTAEPLSGLVENASDLVQQVDVARAETQKCLASSIRFVDGHLHKSAAAARPALARLVERAEMVQEQIEKVKAGTRVHRERFEAKGSLDEVRRKFAAMAEAEKEAAGAEELLNGNHSLSDTKASLAKLADLSEKLESAVAIAKSTVSEKLTEVLKYTETVRKPASEELELLSVKVVSTEQTVEKLKSSTWECRRTALAKEANELLEACEAEVAKMTAAVAPFANDGVETEEDVTLICQKLANFEKAAEVKLGEAKVFLKGQSESLDTTLKVLQGRLTSAREELVRTKDLASDQEERFVALRLSAEASDLVAVAEDDVQNAEEVAASLLAGGETYVVEENLAQVVEAWRMWMREHGGTHEALFNAMRGKEDDISRDAFVAFLENLPLASDALAFNMNQQNAIFAILCKENDRICLEDFTSVLVERFVCVQAIAMTDNFEISGSKSLHKLEPGDVVEAVASPSINEKGIMRLQCSLKGKTGFVSMKGNQGTKFMDTFSSCDRYLQSLERALEKATTSVDTMAAFVKHSAEFSGKNGLIFPKADLAKLKPRANAAQRGVDDLRRKVERAKKEFAKRLKAELGAQREAFEERTALHLREKLSVCVDNTERKVTELTDILQPLHDTESVSSMECGTPLTTLRAAEEILEVVLESATMTRQQLLLQIDRSEGPVHEARLEMTSKVDGAEKKARFAVDTARTSVSKIGDLRMEQVTIALRGVLRARSITADTLFEELAEGSSAISQERFRKALHSLPLNFPSEHSSILCDRIEAGGLGRRNFMEMVQQYFICVKPISMTNDFEISKGKSVRMIELEEVVELLDGPRSDDKVGLPRIRARVLTDGAEGWISVRGNQGTNFLKETGKPFFSCVCDCTIETDTGVQSLNMDETVEVLEGPRVVCGETLRAKCQTILGETEGWLTVQDRRGVTRAELSSRYFIIRATVSMTDDQHIKRSKVLRKLVEGELVLTLEDPIELDGMVRVKVKPVKDNQEGWLTLTGTSGTIFAEKSSVYDVLHLSFLQSSFDSESLIVRTIAKGEAVLVLDGPHKESRSSHCVRVRALSSGTVGWIFQENLKLL